jgi:DNA-directed RNA polymerase subunit RPC12/RpoP
MVAVRSSSFQIDIQCPQCGAPVVLEETENIIECPFCRVRSILSVEPFPCYYFEPRQEKLSHIPVLYVPYWRFKGLEFALSSDHVSYRVIDNSWRAVDTKGVPASLGLRSQTQKLKFIQPDTKGVFSPHSISKKEMLRRMYKEYSDADDMNSNRKVGRNKKQAHIHVGEIISLIYFPFYRTDYELYDGLTGKQVNVLPEQVEEFSSIGRLPQYDLSFMPGLCPNCGWELGGETDSLVLVCKGCSRAFLIRKKRLKQIEVQFAPFNSDTVIFIPFWKLSINFSKIPCSKYSDIMKIANIPKAVLEEHRVKDFYFFIPAFKVNPKLFLRLGKQASLSQPDSVLLDRLPDVDVYPVDLPLQEGLEAVPPVLMNLCKRKRELWDMLIQEKIKLEKYSIVYLAFKEAGLEYVQPEFGFSLPKNSLKFGRKL